MKKSYSIALIAVLMIGLLVLTGCESNENKTKKEENIENTSTITENITTSKENTQKPENATTSKENATSNSGKYVDLENRNFTINGKVYTLGVNTLQEMIDDGVPFDEKSIANANNNINSNMESQYFKIVLGEYYSAQVYVLNDSDENKKIADCKLSKVYLPVSTDKKQDIISFAFPLTITEDELIANAGEPTNKSEYNGDNNYVAKKIEYQVDSSKYIGESGYTFEFTNGVLKYITIDYKP